MSWRTGSRLFLELWPVIKANLVDREERIGFTARLLQLFVEEDMDTWDVEDIDPDIRAACAEWTSRSPNPTGIRKTRICSNDRTRVWPLATVIETAISLDRSIHSALR